MNVIILSPHFPPNHINYARALKKNGDIALGIGDSQDIYDDLRATLDEYVYVPDMTNYDSILRAVAYLTSKYGKIDRIDSQNEFWLGIESKLRDDFNITGQKSAQTDVNRSKIGMKRIAIKAGLPVARGVEVESIDQIRNFIKEVGYPVVMKPVVGVGACSTYALNSDQELQDCFPHIKRHYICEEYIKGDIVTFDGFVNRHGEIEFYTSHEYNAGVMESVNEALSLYYFNRIKIDPKLIELGKRCVEAFGVRERFFHVEWFRTAPNTYCFLEINVRPPGLYTIDMMNMSADINLYEMWAASFHDRRVYKDSKVKYAVGFAGRRDKANHKHSHDEIKRRFSEHIIVAEPVPGAFSDAMGEFFFLLKHPDEDQLIEMLKCTLE